MVDYYVEGDMIKDFQQGCYAIGNDVEAIYRLDPIFFTNIKKIDEMVASVIDRIKRYYADEVITSKEEKQISKVENFLELAIQNKVAEASELYFIDNKDEILSRFAQIDLVKQEEQNQA
ncbi:MAG: hypothetical protein AB7S44_03710 [Spirochaetales bacterium]